MIGIFVKANIRIVIRLFTNYYTDKNKQRQAELEFCLESNISNPLISEVILITEEEAPKKTKIKAVNIGCRPTYSDFFRLINEITQEGDINIISNSDIYFNDSIKYVTNLINKECFALTRWDLHMTKQMTFFDRTDSQDVWIFRGAIPFIEGNFCLGKPGCDNRIAFEIQRTGYRLRNPSLSIQAIHVHNSGIRNFDWESPKDKVPGPYQMISPCII